MSASHAVRRVVALAMVAFATTPLRAQGGMPGAASCSPIVVYNENPSPDATGAIERMHPLLARARWADAVREERWDVALRGLRAEAQEALATGAAPAAASQRFLSELDAVLAALPQLPAEGSPARGTFVGETLIASRFTPIQGVDAFSLFTAPADVDVGALPLPAQRALCWSALAIDQVLFRLQRGLAGPALARLARFNTSWANYRTYGYTRQPLELLVFKGAGGVHDTLPARRQLLLAHLSLGAEVRRLDSLTSATAAVVEVFGVLHYYHDYTQYVGGSVIVSAPSGQRPGVGAMAHLARGMRAGVVLRRDEDADKWRPALVASTDLYGFLERSKRSVDKGLAFARGRALMGQEGEK